MKILIVNNYHFSKGGADVHAMDQRKLLDSHGHQTSFFSMRHEQNPSPNPTNHYIENVEFYNASPLKRLVAASKLVWNPESARKMRELLEKESFDVVHHHNIYHHITPSILPQISRKGIPSIITLHDLKLACPSYAALAHGKPCDRCAGGAYYNAILTGCHKGSRIQSALVALESTVSRVLKLYENNISTFLVPSEFYYKKLLGAGIPQNRLKVLHNFLDFNLFEAKAGVEGDGFLFFGRLSIEKGLRTLIQAVMAIPGMKLTLAGTGPQMEELKKLAEPCSDRIHFPGFVSGKPLQDLIKGSKAIVLPSEWYENFPLSVMEALAMGRPVVGANIGGIPEMVIPGKSGWLFESGNKDALIAALQEAQRNTIDMSQSCHEIVWAKCNAETYYNSLMEIYHSSQRTK